MLRKVRIFLLLSCVSYGMIAVDQVVKPAQQEEQPKKLDDEERQFKTVLDSICKGLASNQCLAVNGHYYPEVVRVVKEFAESVKIEAPQTFVVDADSQAGWFLKNLGLDVTNNARVLYMGNVACVVLIDQWLVDNLTPGEVKSIIAHEMAHTLYKESTLIKAVKISAYGVCGATALLALVKYVIEQDRFKETGENGALVKSIAWLLTFAGVCSAVAPIELCSDRYQEKIADFLAVQLTKSKELASALEKMRQHDKDLYPVAMRSLERREKWLPWTLTHPTLAQRKEYIEQVVID